MIAAHELRIGNWLNPAEPEFKGQYFQIKSGDIKHIEEGMQRYQYEPISITPEILIAAGFKQSDEFAHFYRLEDFDIEFCFGGCYWVVDDRGDNEGTKARQIYYLHQLQNLYFALTGNELTIKL